MDSINVRREQFDKFVLELSPNKEMYDNGIKDLVEMINDLSLIGKMIVGIHRLQLKLNDEIYQLKIQRSFFETELNHYKEGEVRKLRSLDQYKYDYKEPLNIVEAKSIIGTQKLLAYKVYIEYLEFCSDRLNKLDFNIKTKMNIEMGR